MRRFSPVLLVLLLFGVSSSRGQAQPPPARGRAPLVMVVTRGSALKDIPLSGLRQLYLGDGLTAPDGSRLVPLNRLPGSVERVTFDRLVLGMTPEEVGRYWIDRKIRGQGGAPRAYASDDVLLPLVARVLRTVAYIRQDRVDPSVQIVRIDGRLPGDPGYVLAEPPP